MQFFSYITSMIYDIIHSYIGIQKLLSFKLELPAQLETYNLIFSGYSTRNLLKNLNFRIFFVE